jgi:hypothetical protein
MKNPVLAIGILFMVIFLFQLGDKYNWMESRKEKLMPSSCKAVRVKLDRRIPASWATKCEGGDYNNLFVEFNVTETKNEKSSPKNLKALIYRTLANNMILTAKNSPTDNLERTNMVRFRLNHPKVQIDALTEGRFLVKLKTLTSPELIAEHLKVTVQVKESPLKD